MRHSSRKKHLKHVQRSAHIRRMCYFRTIHSLAPPHSCILDISYETQLLICQAAEDKDKQESK